MTVEATIITIRNRLITSNPIIKKWLVESWQAKRSCLCKHRSLRHNTGVFVTIKESLSQYILCSLQAALPYDHLQNVMQDLLWALQSTDYGGLHADGLNHS